MVLIARRLGHVGTDVCRLGHVGKDVLLYALSYCGWDWFEVSEEGVEEDSGWNWFGASEEGNEEEKNTKRRKLVS